LVGYETSSVPSGTGPYLEGAAWADPDIDEAAALMREVYLNRQESAARGWLAREQARTIHTPERTAEFIRRRLAEIRRIELQRQKDEFRAQLKAGLTAAWASSEPQEAGRDLAFATGQPRQTFHQ